MAWVCTCGQKNLVSGLPCLACDRVAPSGDDKASTGPRSRFEPVSGSRFREEPDEKPTPAHRFRDFDVELEPEEEASDESQPATSESVPVDKPEKAPAPPPVPRAPEASNVQDQGAKSDEFTAGPDYDELDDLYSDIEPSRSDVAPVSDSSDDVENKDDSKHSPPGWPTVDRRSFDRRAESDRREAESGTQGNEPQAEHPSPDFFEHEGQSGDAERFPEVSSSEWDQIADLLGQDEPTQANPAITPADRLRSGLAQIRQDEAGGSHKSESDQNDHGAPWWESEDPGAGQTDDFLAKSEYSGYDEQADVRHGQGSPGEQRFVEEDPNLGYDHWEDDDYDDYDDSDYDEPALAQGYGARFSNDVDLDEPDEFEPAGDEWSFDDEDELAVSESREPTRRGKKPAPRRAGAGAGSKSKNRSDLDVAGMVQARSKVVVVGAVLIAIVMLSALGSEWVDRVGAQPASGHGSSVACSAEEDEVGAEDLLSKVADPDGWVAVEDYSAGTGVVDVDRALASEPNAAEALSILDRTRFRSGYDRSFENEVTNEDLKITVYEFAGSSCAADYMSQRTSSAVVTKALDFSTLPSAEAWTTVSADGTASYSAVVRAKNLVAFVALDAPYVSDLAESRFEDALLAQYGLLGS
jgi:hypothetical protein